MRFPIFMQLFTQLRLSNATGFGNAPSFELFINKGAPRVQRRGDGVVLAGAVDEVE